ncbi:hypothetical protein HMN09_00232500 [Mycena chlorophos]|uniref:Cytochrome P450 n=1 Tax=Mycena chlorophos TaxID=658473 RepID=A0A8H6THG0_MYCCL|nr:hypothetical protein HMN09_00232500 [Mycena chlorophos]
MSSLFSDLPQVHVLSVVGGVVALLLVAKAVALLNVLTSKAHFPRIYTAFHPLAIPGAVLPTSTLTTGRSWHWTRRFSTYVTAHSETIDLVPLLSGVPSIWTTNVDIARQVVVGSHRTKFQKPEWSGAPFTLSSIRRRDSSYSPVASRVWGMNVLSADGATWRTHRRVVGPAFGPELYKLVWQQSRSTYHDFMNVEGWDRDGRKSVDVPAIQTITSKFTFLLISSCGLGFPSSTWATPPNTKDGGITMLEALDLVINNHITLLVLPNWAFRLPLPYLRRIRQARERLMVFMHEQIAERKADIISGKQLRADAFTMLVNANQDEDAKYALSDKEIIGNIFVLMAAGHESTSHALSGTLGFLALHESIQDEILQQIIEVVGTERDPIYEDYSKLNKVLAAFYETARMFPAAHVMIREAKEDTILQVPNPVGEEGTTAVPIQKGTQIIVDTIGLQYNMRYNDRPEEYRPSRWYDLSGDSEAFTAFSIGPRACLGRRFASTEAVCFLSLVLRDFRVSPLLNEGETVEGWKARALDGEILMTLGLRDIPLRFERRSGLA